MLQRDGHFELSRGTSRRRGSGGISSGCAHDRRRSSQTERRRPARKARRLCLVDVAGSDSGCEGPVTSDGGVRAPLRRHRAKGRPVEGNAALAHHGQHLGCNIGSSTFRQSLAALLVEDQGWPTRWSGSRTQLIPERNHAFSAWQREHLRLTWVERPCPWTVERHVIALMQPPLNLAANASHPLCRRLKALRAKLREGKD